MSDIKPLTYPARPVNGGPMERSLPKIGRWFYEPKYNGWRTLVHVPSGTMFNRQGEVLSIAEEFATALKLLRRSGLEWLDCEALERRHNIGCGTLIVLDVPWVGPYLKTRELLQRRFTILSVNHLPEENSVYIPPNYEEPVAYNVDGVDVWRILQHRNREIGCDFFEGMVAKKADCTYPIQLQSPEREFPFWVKHRWRW